jgi:hypothetical protein
MTQPFPNNRLQRHALQSLLNLRSDWRCLVITAGPGYGKTSAVHWLIAETHIPAVWLSGETIASAPDPLATLVTAWRKGGLPLPASLEGLVQLPAAKQRVIEILAESTLERPGLLVVFDDLQAVPPTLVPTVTALVSALTDTCRVALLSRPDPAWLPDDDVMARKTIRIGTTDLLLSPSDHLTLIEQMGLPVPAPQVLKRLADLTGGWLFAAVNLLHAGILDRPIDEWPTVLDETAIPSLVASALARLPEALQTFTLRGALLPELSETACRDAWGEQAAAARLAALLAQFPFFQPSTGPSHRFHTLAATVLREMALARLPADETARILTWMTTASDSTGLLAALRDLPCLGDAEAIMVALAVRTVRSDRPDIIDNLIASLPADFTDGPIDRFLRAHALRLRLNEAEAYHLVKDTVPTAALERGWQILVTCLEVDLQMPAATARAVALARALPVSHAWECGKIWLALAASAWKASALPERLRALQEARRAFIAAGDDRGLFKVDSSFVDVRTDAGPAHGLLDAIDDLLRRALASGLIPHPIQYFNFAEAADATGKTDQAIRWLDDGILMANTLNDPQIGAYLKAYRYKYLLQHGQSGFPADEIRQFVLTCRQQGWVEPALVGQLQLVQLAGQDGDERGVQSEIAAFEALCTDLPPADEMFLTGCRAWLALAGGDLDGAAAILIPHLANLERLGRQRLQMEALTLLAQVYRHRRDATRLAEIEATVAHLHRQSGFVAKTPVPSRPATDGQTSPLTLRCFGRMELLDAKGRSLLSRQSRRSQQLLALLMIYPEGLGTDTLIDKLFQNEETTRMAAIMIVHRLRKVLDDDGRGGPGGSWIETIDNCYRLNPDVRLACDWREFQGWYRRFTTAPQAEKRRQACRKLVDLYRGPLFADFETDAWTVQPRELARSQWMQACAWLQEDTRRDDQAEAWELLERQLAIEPAHPDANVRKVRWLVAENRLDEALRHIQIMQRLWEVELGLNWTEHRPAELTALLGEIG